MPQAKGGVESRGEATQMQAKWIKLDQVWNLPRKSGCFTQHKHEILVIENHLGYCEKQNNINHCDTEYM